MRNDAVMMPQLGHIPPSDRFRQEIIIQEEVQERHLAKNAKLGKEK